MEGNLTTTSECVKKTCSEKQAEGSNVGVNCGGNAKELDGTCSLTCADGYELQADAGLQATCQVDANAPAETDPVFKIPDSAKCVKPTPPTTMARTVETTAADAGTVLDPATTSKVEGSITLQGNFAGTAATAFEEPITNTLVTTLDLAKSLIAVNCRFTASSAGAARRLNQTGANQSSNQTQGAQAPANNQAPATNQSQSSNQDLQADYVIQIPDTATGLQSGSAVTATGISSIMEGLGSNTQFLDRLKQQAADAGLTVTITGVQSSAQMTASTGSGGGGGAGGSGGGAGGAGAVATEGTEEGGNTGAIIGGVIGGLVGIGLIGACIFFVMKKKKDQE